MNHRSPGLSFKKAIEGYQKYKVAEGLSPRTIEAYQHYFHQWLNHMGDMLIKDISTEHITDYLGWYRTTYVPIRFSNSTVPLSPKTIRNAWIAFRSLWRWLNEEFGYENVVAKVKPPKFHPTEIKPYTKEELECMLISCKYTKVSETVFRKKFKMQRPSATRDTAILLCLLATGMRASDICYLNVGDLDINTGKVTIKHGSEGGAKGGTGRTVFIGKKSRKYLWKYLNDREELRDTDPLFISQTNRPFTKDSLRILIKRIAKRADVKDAYTHKFRHTFAITYLRSGGDVFTLQKLLGHGSLDMVKHYARVAELDVEQAHRRASPVDNLHL